jgi:hypothetical protein
MTPYGKGRGGSSAPGSAASSSGGAATGGADNYLVQRGYIEIVEDVRGTGRSVTAPMQSGQRTTGRYQLIVGPWEHLNGSGVNVDPAHLESGRQPVRPPDRSVVDGRDLDPGPLGRVARTVRR